MASAMGNALSREALTIMVSSAAAPTSPAGLGS
jgi:hypothetical protein